MSARPLTLFHTHSSSQLGAMHRLCGLCILIVLYGAGAQKLGPSYNPPETDRTEVVPGYDNAVVEFNTTYAPLPVPYYILVNGTTWLIRSRVISAYALVRNYVSVNRSKNTKDVHAYIEAARLVENPPSDCIEAGHILASRFGGSSSDIYNFIPQNGKQNRGIYSLWEGEIRKFMNQDLSSLTVITWAFGYDSNNPSPRPNWISASFRDFRSSHWRLPFYEANEKCLCFIGEEASNSSLVLRDDYEDGDGSFLPNQNDASFDVSFSGPWNATVTIGFTRIGNVVTLMFPDIYGTCTTESQINAAVIPVPLRPWRNLKFTLQGFEDMLAPVHVEAILTITIDGHIAVTLLSGEPIPCATANVTLTGFAATGVTYSLESNGGYTVDFASPVRADSITAYSNQLNGLDIMGTKFKLDEVSGTQGSFSSMVAPTLSTTILQAIGPEGIAIDANSLKVNKIVQYNGTLVNIQGTKFHPDYVDGPMGYYTYLYARHHLYADTIGSYSGGIFVDVQSGITTLSIQVDEITHKTSANGYIAMPTQIRPNSIQFGGIGSVLQGYSEALSLTLNLTVTPSTAVTNVSMTYTKVGRLVALTITAKQGTCTSSAVFRATFFTHIFPVGLRATTSMYFPIWVQDNGVWQSGSLFIASDGSWGIYKGYNSAFTGAGLCGWQGISVSFTTDL